MRNTPRHVLIIGGGIAGPALGVFLKRAGIPATVFEAYSPKEGIGGGLGLGPNGVYVLDALGVANEVKSQASRIDAFRFRNDRGRVLAAFSLDAERRFGQPMLGLSRAAMAETVTRKAQHEGVQINYQKRLIGIEQDSDGVVASFEDGTSASGDLLIGADGVRSATRRLALPESPEPAFTGLIGIGGSVDNAAGPSLTATDRSSMTFSFGANGFFGFSGCGNGRSMWWTNLPRSAPLSRAELLETPTDVLKQELTERFGEYFAPIPRLIAASESLVQLNVFDIQSLPRWSSGRALLLGDAAHAVSPNAGQGAALALEDAMLLARLLRDVSDYREAFSAFEGERKPRVQRIVAEGRRRGGDKQVLSPFQARLRELIMSVMLKAFAKHGDDWVWRHRIDWDAQSVMANAA